jgi:hypothetical protein
MNLSKKFTLEELCVTHTKLVNNPNLQAKIALTELAQNVLQPVRDKLNTPISVNSGYRSSAVNKAVGGAENSQHTKGEAADIVSYDNRLLFDTIRDTVIFDQLIWEYGDDKNPAWVHVSYKTQGNRNEVLRAYKDNGKTKYVRL